MDRCSTPWLVVGMHRPMYVVFPHKSNRDVGDHLREQLEDLLLDYKVPGQREEVNSYVVSGNRDRLLRST